MTRPTGQEIRNDGAIPWASQIPNDSDLGGKSGSIADALNIAAKSKRVVVADVSVETLGDEQTVALGGLSTEHFSPITSIVHMTAVGEGNAANGDLAISIGITTGGTEILAATVVTGLIGINTKKVIDLSSVVKPALPANSTIYVKVTTKDTTAGAGHLADVYINGETIPGA